MTHPPEKMKLTVVRIGDRLRCVYVNNFRLVGNKPYVSEGGEYLDIEFTADDLKRALPYEWCGAINALAGIPNEQIERDKELYAHVDQMKDALICARTLISRLDELLEYGMSVEDEDLDEVQRKITAALTAPKLEESQ